MPGTRLAPSKSKTFSNAKYPEFDNYQNKNYISLPEMGDNTARVLRGNEI